MTERSKDFETALAQWLEQAQNISDTYMAQRFPSLPKPVLTLRRGPKRVKVVRDSSVHCFVDIETGEVLKAASWLAPAKGARGSIYNPDQPGVGPYGGLYRK